MRLLVCGSRHWTDKDSIRREILSLMPDVVIEGEANGADKLARQVAEEHGIAVDPHDAKWGVYGDGAGPIRNQEMLDQGKPDMVLAFHEDPRLGRGTKDMVERAVKAGLQVRVILQRRS